MRPKIVGRFLFLRVFVFVLGSFWCFIRLPARFFTTSKVMRKRSSSKIWFFVFTYRMCTFKCPLCSISSTLVFWYKTYFKSVFFCCAVLCLILYFLGKVHKYLTFFLLWVDQEKRKKGSEAETKKMILWRRVLKCKIFFVLEKFELLGVEKKVCWELSVWHIDSKKTLTIKFRISTSTKNCFDFGYLQNKHKDTNVLKWTFDISWFIFSIQFFQTCLSKDSANETKIYCIQRENSIVLYGLAALSKCCITTWHFLIS